MVESAALLVDEVLPEQPIRQWVLSFPFQLRFLFASRPQLMGRALGIVYRSISAHLIKKTGFTRKTAQTGAVTLIQRFGSALNVHFHMLFLDGVYTSTPWARLIAGSLCLVAAQLYPAHYSYQAPLHGFLSGVIARIFSQDIRSRNDWAHVRPGRVMIAGETSS